MERVRHGTGAISDSQIPGCTPGSALTLCVAPGVRDYIHVVDLAKGHIAALKKLKENCGCKVPTLGCCQPWGGVGLAVGAEGGPGPSPLDPCPLSSSQIYNLGTGTGYSVLQMVRAMEKASGREVRADLQGHGHSCSHRPPDAPTAALAPFPQPLWEPPEPTVLLSLQIKYRITARREGDVASCYADPALAERELGWKAAFGLDKMCKGIPSLARWALPGPCPPSPPLSLFQVRTCGGGSCRTPRASARTEPWPRAGRARGLL